MNILFVVFGIVLIAFVVGFQFKVCKKYLFEYAKTKVDETRKTITIKNKSIAFSEIKEVYVHDIEINAVERFLVSVLFYNGVSEMKLILNNGANEIVILPKNYISLFCKQMESAGVHINW